MPTTRVRKKQVPDAPMLPGPDRTAPEAPIRIRLISSDVIAVAVGWSFAILTTSSLSGDVSASAVICTVASVVTALILAAQGLYSVDQCAVRSDGLPGLAIGCFGAGATVLALPHLNGDIVSVRTAMVGMLATLALLVLSRSMLSAWLRTERTIRQVQ